MQITKKNLAALFSLAGCLVLFLGVVQSTPALAQSFNQQINYQGKLTASSSVAVADGTYSMVFRLYTVQSGGTNIWSETQDVEVQNGLFSVMLGTSTSLASVDFSQTLYLGVNIEADGEMTPRKILGAVPAAFEANNATTFDNLATTSFLRSDQDDTASGLLTFTGGFISSASSTINRLTTGTTTVTTLDIGGEEITSLTGTGLTNTSGTLTVATSTLGLGDGSFLGLSDTGSSFTANRLLFTNGAGDAVTDSAGLTYDGSNLNLGANQGLAIDGVRVFTRSLGSISIGRDAGLNNTGTDNNFSGRDAGSNNSGENNNFFGSFTGSSNSGNDNNVFGETAGQSNDGDGNNIMGRAAGHSNEGSNNNIFGDSAGYFNTGSNNNFLGSLVGVSNTGNFNEMIGYQTGRYLQSTSTVAIGGQALYGPGSNYISLNNVALGYRAGYASDDGSGNNILLGYQAADSLTTGANNIVIGYDVEAPSNTGSNQLNIGNLLFGTGIDGTGTTLSSGNIGIGTSTPSARLTVAGDINITSASAYKYNGADVIIASTTLNNYFFGGAGNLTMTGNNNTANGYRALYSNTIGNSNTANGYRALYSNTTGNSNTANGFRALYSNTLGGFNTANGFSALRSNTLGNSNTANGVNALYSNTTGSDNTANGFQAGYDINTATSTGANTVIGYNTGRGIVTGVNNTILGANVTGLSSTLSNNIIIADGAGNQRLNIDASGNVGIGTTTPDTKLQVAGAITQQPLSSDPADPDAGNSVQWVSDGTGSGDAGDVLLKVNVAGTTKIITLIDWSVA